MGWQSSVLGVGRAYFPSGSSERFSEVNVGSTLVNYMCFQVSMFRNMEAWCCAGQQNLQLPLYLQVGFLANRQPGWALAVSGTGSSVSKSWAGLSGLRCCTCEGRCWPFIPRCWHVWHTSSDIRMCSPQQFLLLELQDHLPKRGRPHCPSPRNCNGSMGFLVQDLGEEQARTTHTRGGGCIHWFHPRHGTFHTCTYLLT